MLTIPSSLGRNVSVNSATRIDHLALVGFGFAIIWPTRAACVARFA